jgi:anti-sigma factor RsiW
MSDQNGNLNCGNEANIVSYLYGELDGRAKSDFESHLSSCTACTDEFAGLSHARLSVFEWHRDEFEPLVTPRFVNPAVTAESAGVSWLAGLKGLLSGIPTFAAVPAAAVVLFVAIGGAFFVLRSSQVGNEVAGVNSNKAIVNPPVMTTPAPAEEPKVVQAPAGDKDRRVVPTAVSPVQIVNKTATPAVKRDKDPVVQTNVRVPNRTTTSAPRLNPTDADTDDNTLRLADIFDDIDTDR